MDKKQSISSISNWADDVEAEEAELGQAPLPVDEVLYDRPSYALSSGAPSPRFSEQSGPRSSRELMGAGAPLPDAPPFKAYIGNVAYDLEEDAVEHFFRGLQITDIMVTRHRDTGRAKGCFVEFTTRDDLEKALSMNGRDLLRRSISIKVAEPRQGGPPPRGGSRERDGFFGYGDRRGSSRPERGGGGGSFNRFDDDRGPPGRWNAVREVPVVESSTPRERPKLILQPRRPTEGEAAAAPGETEAPSAKPNPFGGARPANTAAKLLELEEREAQRKAEAAAAKAAAKTAAASAAAAAAVAGPEGEKLAAPLEESMEQLKVRGGGGPEATRPPAPPPGLRGEKPRGDRSRERGPPRDFKDRESFRSDSRGEGGGRAGAGYRAPRGGRGGGRGERPDYSSDLLPHHRQGESGRGRGGRGGRGGKPAAPAPPKFVPAPGEDELPKTKVSNPFDLLGDE